VPASRVHLQASHFSSATFAISFYKELLKKDKGSLTISIREARTLEAEKQRKALAISVPTDVPFVTNASSSSSFPSSNATSSGTTSSTDLAPTPEQSRFINSIDAQLQQLRDAARCSAATPFDYAANVHLQFLKLVHGGPGCGKTFCIQKIVKLLETYNIGYMCLAETGIAACLMPNGHTVCSGLGIQVGRNVKNKSDSSLGKNYLKPLSVKELGFLRSRHPHTLVCFLDEVSFTDAVQLGKISLRSGELTGYPGLRFGGISVILIGDFHQLPPVGGTPLPTSLLLHHGLINCVTGDSMVGSLSQPVVLKSPEAYVPACIASASTAHGKLARVYFKGPQNGDSCKSYQVRGRLQKSRIAEGHWQPSVLTIHPCAAHIKNSDSRMTPPCPKWCNSCET
jgi:hypothetical protein